MAYPTAFVHLSSGSRQETAQGLGQGRPAAITASGLKSIWRRSHHRRKGSSLPEDLRFHDLRHDFATKLLRETNNLRLVQKALHHSRVETTTNHAHVLAEYLGSRDGSCCKFLDEVNRHRLSRGV